MAMKAFMWCIRREQFVATPVILASRCKCSECKRIKAENKTRGQSNETRTRKLGSS